ncbi:MAG: chorismate mutase [Alphaproteobacteria bacterium]|nr:chorismate mutase [Alphaproteobacteria bacterium]MBL6937468.1 chorismate mutase [Alphaproteobacteria bacterium]MBL7098806.1 chorismate mutase [Alphaproteobacteria bacterium]
MPPRKTTPADVPAQIDALDDKIQDLLIKRAALATSVTPAKQSQTLRRLAARHKGNLPLRALVSIWREIMAVAASPKRVVHVYAADRAGVFRDMARGLFGSSAPMESHLSATTIVTECSNDHEAFGIVPPPESDENARPWWSQLAPVGTRGPRIVAVLPLVGGKVDAYVIGSLDPEASGDDTTVCRVEAEEQVSPSRLQSLLKQAGLDARPVAVGRAAGMRQHLMEIPGFVASDDPRLGTLLESAAGAVRVSIVGGYANPLASEAAKP